MDLATFTLAATPPVLAFFAELIHLPPRPAIEADASLVFRDFEGLLKDEAFQVLLRTVEDFTDGAAAMARLWPTVISGATSGLWIWLEFSPGLVGITLYMVSLIIVGALLVYVFMSVSLADVSTDILKFPFLGRHFTLFGQSLSITRVKLVFIITLSFNVGLTFLWAVAYMNSLLAP